LSPEIPFRVSVRFFILHRKRKKFEFCFDFFCLDGEKNDGSELLKEKVEGFSLFGRDGR
jgi:hypothetical protein